MNTKNVTIHEAYNAIDSVKAAVESGDLSISTANEIAKHNTTKQQEIISSPAKKIKTADVRNINVMS